jgi:hypothetical protein
VSVAAAAFGYAAEFAVWAVFFPYSLPLYILMMIKEEKLRKLSPFSFYASHLHYSLLSE